MKKIFLKGPILTQTGYGHHTRTVFRALKSRPDLYDIYLQPIPWGKCSWLWEDDKERQEIDSLLNKTIEHNKNGGTYDASIQVTIPNEWEKIAPINIGVTAGIETDKVDVKWIEKSYLMDKIVTISKHSKDVYENTSYNAVNRETGEEVKFATKTPIDYVTYPVRLFKPEKLDLKLDTDFNFLAVAQLSPRKNVEQLIRCFIENFKDNEDVGLIIKANMAKNSLIDRINTLSGFRRVLSQMGSYKCKVYLLHGYLTDEEMSGLYNHPKVKAFVSTAHGEGFGLPIFEAAYYGLPVIATNWSGHLDFLYKPQKNNKLKHMFSKISYSLKEVQNEVIWDGVLPKGSKWAYPEEGSIKMNIDEVYKDYGRFKKRAKELQSWINEEYSEEKQNLMFLKALGQDLYYEPADFIFVSDLFSDQYVGGAELSLQALIDDCPSTSAKFNSLKVTKEMVDFNKNATWVFGNIAQIKDEVLQYVIDNNINYYFVEFDYKFCEYRNPLLYEFLEDEKCDYSETDKGKLIQSFINNSAKTFFMSEEQKNIFKENLHVDSDRLFVLSSIFDDNFFETIESLNKNKSKKTDKWLVLGSKSWVKGFSQSEKWCKDNNLEYEVVSDLSHEQLLDKLAKAKGICFKPTGLDTCPRYVIEAKLLGCELEINENVQHVDEPWFASNDNKNIINYLKNRREVFWNEVRSVNE